MHTRQSGIELLRLLSMLGIVIGHYFVHAPLAYAGNAYFAMSFFETLPMLGHTANLIFVMISGYFLATSAEVKWSRVLRLCLECAFFAVCWLVVDIILIRSGYIASEDVGIQITWTSILFNSFRSLFAFGGSQNWFIWPYLVVYVIHPFINRGFASIGFKSHLSIALLLGIIAFLIPLLEIGPLPGNFFLFMSCYVIGALLRLYKDRFSWQRWKKGVLCLLFVIFTFVGLSAARYVSYLNQDNLLGKICLSLYRRLYGNTSPLAAAIAVSAVLFFSELNFQCRPINFMATTVFGTYLFHDAYYARPVLFKIIGTDGIVIGQTPFGIVASNFALWIAIAFFGGMAIELLRQYALEKPILLLLRKQANQRKNGA